MLVSLATLLKTILILLKLFLFKDFKYPDTRVFLKIYETFREHPGHPLCAYIFSRIWSLLLNIFIMENFIFLCIVKPTGKIIINFSNTFDYSPVKYFVKKLLLKSLQNSRENPCKIQEKTSGVLLIIICNSFKLATLLKKTAS